MAKGISGSPIEGVKIALDDFPQIAKKIRSTDVYDVLDLTDWLSHMTISETILHPGKHTKGHSHDNHEEVYLFLEGLGEMELGTGGEDDYRFPVGPKDLVPIRAGIFHRVYNTMSDGDLKVLCVFEKYEERDKEAGQPGKGLEMLR